MANSRDGITDFIFGFVVGGVIGAGTALLLAPAKGEETRQMIGGKFNDAVSEGKREIETVRDVVQQELAKLGTQKEAIRDAFDKGVETFRNRNAEDIATEEE
ncbi:MAG: YtxH domain-containing protein [Candidatus Zixiibacteriota bacterium]